MLVRKESPPAWRYAWIFSVSLFFIFIGNVEAEQTHSAGNESSGTATVRRQDRNDLVKKLGDVFSRNSVSRPKSPKSTGSIFRLVEADDSRVKEAETLGIPASVSLVALRIENGVTPKELFDLVQKVKTDVGTDEFTVSSRELARRLLANPSKLKELYKKADGTFDFDALAKDLGLDTEELRPRREALQKALAEDPTAPVETDVVDPTDPNAPVTDDTVIDPSQFVDDGLNNGGLDDTVVNQDDFVFDDQAQNKLDEEKAAKARKEADQAKNALNEGKDGKNGKEKGAGAAKAPPPPKPPRPADPPLPGIPPISIGGGNSPPPPLPLPPPPEIPPPPPFQMPPPPQEAGISPGLLALLAGVNKTGERRPPDAGMQDILQAFAAMNQQTVNAILQLGQTMMMMGGAGRTQITATPPSSTNVAGQGSNITARIQSFSGQPTSAKSGPRSTSSANTIANSMQAQSPRTGTVPGYDSGTAGVTARGAGRSIVKPRH